MRLERQDLAPDIFQAIAEKVIESLRPLLSGKGKQPGEDPILDVKELAEYLKVDASWVYKKISLREIPHFHAGKYPRFKKSQIDKWIESQTVKPVSPF